jgi:ABC-type antimicrobial peptide transport system permease subunit
MFYVRYALAELRRRKARTLLTALVLATGVGLVVAVTALSRGLDEAQERVLEPLSGVGTAITVTRPLRLDRSSSGSGGPLQLSEAERRRLEAENGDQRLGLTGLGQPSERFRRDRFRSAQLSYPENTAQAVAAIAGVQVVARELTLNVMRVSGTLPTASERGGGVIGRGFGAGAGGGPPRTIAFTGFTFT